MKAILIAILFVSVSASAQDDKNGTIKIEKTKVYTVVDEMPSFPGGNNSMNAFIQENLKFPAAELENRIQGTVFISFVVGADGTLSSFQILKGVNGGVGYDMEAMRVAMLMPKWIPGRKNGLPVAVRCNWPLAFKLK